MFKDRRCCVQITALDTSQRQCRNQGVAADGQNWWCLIHAYLNPNAIVPKKVEAKTDWFRMEKRIRNTLRLVNQQCITETRLRDALTTIDEIVANETGRGNEISAGGLSGTRTIFIQRHEWLPK